MAGVGALLAAPSSAALPSAGDRPSSWATALWPAGHGRSKQRPDGSPGGVPDAVPVAVLPRIGFGPALPAS